MTISYACDYCLEIACELLKGILVVPAQLLTMLACKTLKPRCSSPLTASCWQKETPADWAGWIISLSVTELNFLTLSSSLTQSVT